MFTSQWSPEIIAIYAMSVIFTAIVSFFIATSRQGRQLSSLAAQLERALEGQATAGKQVVTLQTQLKATETQSHALQVEQGRLQAQLDASSERVIRVVEDMQASKDENSSLRATLEDTKQQHHETAKQLETAQAQGRSLAEQIKDLRERLETAQSANATLQTERGSLKDEMAGYETQTKVAQTAEREAREQLTETRSKLAEQVARYDALQSRYEPLSNTHAELKTSLDRTENQIIELRERLDKAQAAVDQLHTVRDQLKDDLATEGKRAKVLETSEREVREQLSESKLLVIQREKTIEELQKLRHQLSSEHTELKTTLQKREEHFQEQLAQLSDTKKSFAQEFENLANKIFDEKGKTFTHTSQASIDGLLKPFREQIEGFQKRINDVHDASLQGNTNLNAEIKKVLDIGLKMSSEANNLTSALKGDSQQRGAWGEAQLQRTLEMSGLVEEAHYEVQSSFKDAEGKTRQTDYLIKIPDGKHIIIDSKVSLVAYDRAVSAESPEEYLLALNEHVKAVRRHIDDLSSKDYTNLVGMRSPSFVLMFMPIEPAYIEAMKHNKDLFEYGYTKNIVLVSHTTLIPILRTVSNLWMVERSNAEAREVSERAGDIYNQVSLIAERLAKLGGTLNTASNHYNKTVTALAGKQGLYGKVERFNQLSAKVSKTLPQLEPAHMDFESERLSLIVEPIEEPSELDSSNLQIEQATAEITAP